MADRREKTLFFAAVALLLLAAAAGYWLLLGSGISANVVAAPPAPLRVPAPPVVEKLAIVQVEGQVRIRRAGTDAGWLEARVGDELHPDDSIETGSAAAVGLAAGDRYRVDLDANVRFGVKEITAELTRVRLEAGLLNASVRADPSRAFEVEAGADAVTRTRGGDFAMTSNGQDVVAVGVTRGEVELQSRGKVVVIKPGQQSIAAGGPPSAPAPIPSSLLLKVVWPRDMLLNKRKLTVTGRTLPGAMVDIGGSPVRVGSDGSFKHVIYLREGQQTLSVRGRDVGGHRVDEKGPLLLVDTHGADADFDTRDLWGGEAK